MVYTNKKPPTNRTKKSYNSVGNQTGFTGKNLYGKVEEKVKLKKYH